MPEFAEIITVIFVAAPADPRLRPGFVWPECRVNGVRVPAEARTVRSTFGGEAGSNRGSSSSSTSSATSPTSLVIPRRACVRDADAFSENDFYIGREFRTKAGRFVAASPFANPFKVADCPDRGSCIKKFDAFLRSSASLLRLLPALSGKRLLCHCGPHQQCHGDAIIAAFRELCLASDAARATVQVGVYADIEKFTEAAVSCRHPFDETVCPSAVLGGLPFRGRRYSTAR